MDSPAERNNCARVIDMLVRQGELTRPQMCEKSGITPAAMHAAVTRLIACGTVERMEGGVASGGRRAHLHRLRAHAGLTAGVHIALHTMTLGLYDLRRTPLCERTLTISPRETGAESCCVALCEALRHMQSEFGREYGPLLGLGVAIDAQVRPRDGSVTVFLGAPVWQGYPLAQRLSQMTGVPVCVRRSACAQMDALMLRGDAPKAGTAVYLGVRERIEAAVMLDGRTLDGGHGLAGELGHVTVRRDGAACACGNAGCLHLYSSQDGIVRQYNAASGNACRSIGDVMERLAAEDAAAVKAVTQAALYLVDVLVLLELTYDPDVLLIDCPWLAGQEPLRGRMIDALHAKSVYTRQHLTQIHFLPQAAPLARAACAQVLLRMAPEDVRVLAPMLRARVS